MSMAENQQMMSRLHFVFAAPIPLARSSVCEDKKSTYNL